MALLWFVIYAVLGFVFWKIHTNMSVTQRRNTLLNIALVILFVGACGATYELFSTGSVGIPASY